MNIKWILFAFLIHFEYLEAATLLTMYRKIKDKSHPKSKNEKSRKVKLHEEYGYNFQSHNTFETIENYLKKLEENYKNVKIETIRKSYEERPIYAVHVGDTKKKPIVIFECLMHAREWTAVETCIFFLRMLVGQKATGSREMLSKYGFIFMPVTNPDGYVYTWNQDPMWRKTRNCDSEQCKGPCVGVDGNRNFPSAHVKFCSDKISSKDPCKETYCGQKPLSVNESMAVHDLLKQVKGKLFAYMCVHSTAGMWLLPYAKNAKVPHGFTEMKRVADLAVKEMERKTGWPRYQVGTATKILYSTIGTSYDYAIDYGKAKYSFTVEMRDDPAKGKDLQTEANFSLREDLVYGVISEMYVGLKTAILAMKNEGDAL